MKKKSQKPTVIDFFCGAGGFSEGFRQEGFEIVLGIDHWQPAMDTFNYNFNKELSTKNIHDFANSIEEIENLPDTDVIIGSPPCVSFSSSNKSGKADKSLGVKLTETFLRIVAVKKYKRNSKLKAWFMENVTNSRRYLQPSYTFHDLKLTDWARKNRLSPSKVAIQLSDNSSIINSAEYGSVQIRKRVISGEIIKLNRLIIPSKTHKDVNEEGNLIPFNTIATIKNKFPSPFEKKSDEPVEDPLYLFKIPQNKITDHFYDTGVYECEWQNSKYLKQNHPYMGVMSFPENNSRPSRTITATKIANSRESIIYKSEIKRKGDGEFRLPTVREAALIMGFPITYQFIGAENTKWRLVGNAVCIPVSRAFARVVRKSMRLKLVTEITLAKDCIINDSNNLNSFKLKIFNKPPIKNKGARFRRHAIKEGNMTIALSNYDIARNGKKAGKWRVSAFYGTGEGFKISNYKEGYYKVIEPILVKTFPNGNEFVKIINNGFSEKIADKKLLQEMFEKRKSIKNYLEPTRLIDEVANIVNDFSTKGEVFEQSGIKIFKREIVPKKQLYALYAINKIVTTANRI